MKILVAGFKELSLIDVHGHPSSVLWVCGCNLKCPFCHNWLIATADPRYCELVEIDRVIEWVRESSMLVDYFHVTGGEPLLQVDALLSLYSETRRMGLRNSVNTNATLPSELEKLLRTGVVEHVALDLKIPFEELTGMGNAWRSYWDRFKISLKILGDYDVVVELRIPVARELTRKYLDRYLDEIASSLKRINRLYVVVNPLIGEPLVNPRDREWSRKYCFPRDEELASVRDSIEAIIGCKVVVKKWW